MGYHLIIDKTTKAYRESVFIIPNSSQFQYLLFISERALIKMHELYMLASNVKTEA